MTLERDTTTVVFKNVPAEVCENCGEAFLDVVNKVNVRHFFRSMLGFLGQSLESPDFLKGNPLHKRPEVCTLCKFAAGSSIQRKR